MLADCWWKERVCVWCVCRVVIGLINWRVTMDLLGLMSFVAGDVMVLAQVLGYFTFGRGT